MLNNMAGWIKISKDINKHWIWGDPVKLKWWLDILLTVNFEDKKFPIKYKVFECKRGESLLSLVEWAKRWGVSKSVVNNFFTMLENDNMIKTVNETVTTRLIVCNYDTYQQSENANKTQTKRSKNATETQGNTTKEYIKNKEEKEEELYAQFAHLKISNIEFDKLISAGFTKSQIDIVLAKIENYAKNGKYKSLYLTALDWLKKDFKKDIVEDSEMTHQQLKKHLWNNHLIQMSEIDYLSFEQLMANYKSGKYPKK